MSETIFCNRHLKKVEGIEGNQDGDYWSGSIAVACLHPDCFRRHQAFNLYRLESVEHAIVVATRTMEADCLFVGSIDEMTVTE